MRRRRRDNQRVEEKGEGETNKERGRRRERDKHRVEEKERGCR